MSAHLESGPLDFEEVKGLHYLSAGWWIETGIHDAAFRLTDYEGHQGSEMDAAGKLDCRRGYLWDGSSGPTIDGKADPVPSLVHDTLYEAFRAGKLDPALKPRVDALYRDLLRERGMGVLRAWTRWAGLRLFGWVACRQSSGPEYPRRVAA